MGYNFAKYGHTALTLLGLLGRVTNARRPSANSIQVSKHYSHLSATFNTSFPLIVCE